MSRTVSRSHLFSSVEEALGHTPIWQRRSTLTLVDPDALRGTTASVLLHGFGKRLRASSGGIGMVSAEDEYIRSFPVERLGYFLSHSWHAWWLLKYLTLLLYLNVLPAVIVAISAGLAIRVLKHFVSAEKIWADWDAEKNFLKAWLYEPGHGARNIYTTSFSSLPVGGLFFFALIFFWHHIVTIMPWGKSNVFLDKVCIHQSDAVKKERGIKSIGGMLQHSRTLLITWDHTYFERLWCTFELAAFKHGQPHGSIVFLPTMLGGAVTFFSLGALLVETVRICVAQSQRGTNDDGLEGSFWDYSWRYSYSTMSIGIILVARKYARDLVDLRQQLDTFSVRDAKCFCCANDHILRETGAALSCDRELVYSAIGRWYGGSHRQSGLNQFDKLVQTTLLREVFDTLTGFAQIPYSMALSFSLWNALVALDIVWIYTSDRWTQMCFLIDAFFFELPIYFGLALAICMYCPSRSLQSDSSWFHLLQDLLMNGVVAVPASLFQYLHGKLKFWVMFRMRQWWLTIILLVVEAVIVLALYNRKARFIIRRSNKRTWERLHSWRGRQKTEALAESEMALRPPTPLEDTPVPKQALASRPPPSLYLW